MGNEKENETLVAYVTMKTRSGLSIHKDIRKLSLNTIDQFRPKPNHVDQVVDLLIQAGFTILAQTAVGVSISGTKELFESEFKVSIHRKETWVKETDRPRKETWPKETDKPQEMVVFYESSQPFMMSPRIEPFAESVHLSRPAILFHEVNPPVPGYYFLNVLEDIPLLLNVNSLHKKGITGKGVRISMVDTGFVTRVEETLDSKNAKDLTVDHEIWDVQGVWLRTNYFTGGSFADKTITLGTPLPGTVTSVQVEYVDTGLVTRIEETKNYNSATGIVTVGHEVRHVQGVWTNNSNRTGTNYFTDGSFADKTITLGTQLPGDVLNVFVVYSCLHPHYLPPHHYNIDDKDILGVLVPDMDVNTDEDGHGCAMAANVLAVAPGCTFSFVKFKTKQNNTYSSYPVAGFMAAVENQKPDIISCSWTVSSSEDRNAVTLQAVDAVATKGIVVLFATGNSVHGNDKLTISHPNVISVGGAYPKQGGGFEASDYASSYDSIIYKNPQRHCPDVVGLVRKVPSPDLIMLPTQPKSLRDLSFKFEDKTKRDDGWIVISGTSAATQQAAGVAALLLQQYPDLAPMSVKNILENSARDIVEGRSAPGYYAVLGWDPATGFGLIDGQAAVGYLGINQFKPYIRQSREDKGNDNMVDNLRLWASPDIIVRSQQVDPQWDELGQTVKHRFDLCNKVESGQDNYIYLRVQNRGALTGDCTATVYFIDSELFPDPAALKEIGQLNIPNLAPGEFRVADPLHWPVGLVPSSPASGLNYIIAFLVTLGSPAPDLTTINSLDDLIIMVPNGNIAGIQIDVVDVIP